MEEIRRLEEILDTRSCDADDTPRHLAVGSCNSTQGWSERNTAGLRSGPSRGESVECCLSFRAICWAVPIRWLGTRSWQWPSKWHHYLNGISKTTRQIK